MVRRWIGLSAAATLGAALIAAACSAFESSNPATDAGTDRATVDSDSAPAADAQSEASSRRHLYVFGGVAEAFRAEVLADGTLGAWQRAENLDRARSSVAWFSVPAGIVIAGGDDVGGLLRVASVEIAKPSADGGLGPWTSAPDLPEGRTRPAAGADDRFLYVAGGVDPSGNPNASVFMAQHDLQGIRTWTAGGTLPDASATGAIAVVAGRLYVVGGGPTYWFTTLAPDGGATGWSDAGAIDAAGATLQNHALAYAGARLVAVGGRSLNNSPVARVLTGEIAPAGTVTWSSNSALPAPLSNPCVVADGSRIYVLGGETTPDGGTAEANAATAFAGEVVSGTLTWTALRDMPAARTSFGCAIR